MTLIFIFLFGLIIGSFLNCLIWRTYQGKSFIKGRSICPKCRHQLAWQDNIPILSFIMLSGKCRWCGKPISWQYPLVELATAILFVLAYFVELRVAGCGLRVLAIARDWFFIAVLIIIFVQDLRWQVILDRITLPAMAAALLFNLILGFSLGNLLISAIIGGSFFAIQYLVSRGRWIGGGDIRMGALMGLMLGWSVLLAIMFGYWLGAIAGIYLILSGQKKFSSKIPLGTFLAIGTIAALFWGEAILEIFNF
ncbi:MAG: prepilin peptidase [bacterium]